MQITSPAPGFRPLLLNIAGKIKFWCEHIAYASTNVSLNSYIGVNILLYRREHIVYASTNVNLNKATYYQNFLRRTQAYSKLWSCKHAKSRFDCSVCPPYKLSNILSIWVSLHGQTCTHHAQFYCNDDTCL